MNFVLCFLPPQKSHVGMSVNKLKSVGGLSCPLWLRNWSSLGRSFYQVSELVFISVFEVYLLTTMVAITIATDYTWVGHLISWMPDEEKQNTAKNKRGERHFKALFQLLSLLYYLQEPVKEAAFCALCFTIPGEEFTKRGGAWVWNTGNSEMATWSLITMIMEQQTVTNPAVVIHGLCVMTKH